MPLRTLAGVVAVAILATSALAQPPERGPQPQQEERTQEDLEREREVLRKRLEQRLEQIREIEAQIESAMGKLDEGATPEEIVFSFRPGVFDLHPRDRDGGPRDGRPGQDPPPPNPLDTPERVDAFMTEHLPDLAAWMNDFRSRNPEIAERFMDRLMRQLGPIAALEHTDPDLFKLRLEEYRVGYQILEYRGDYRESATSKGPQDPATLAIRRQLAAALELRFDIKLQVLRHEIETVEGRVTALHDELAETESTRSETIDRQLRYFTDLSERRRRRGASRDDDKNGRPTESRQRDDRRGG